MTGALVNHLYRDYRDRPILDISIDAVYRARVPLALPPDLHREVKFLGALHVWLDRVVKWDAERAFSEKTFSLQQLVDVRHLAPRFVKEAAASIADATSMMDAMRNPQAQPTLDQRLILARLRHNWFERTGQDLFIAWNQNATQTAAQMSAHLGGDVEQRQLVLNGVRRLQLWLDAGLSPTTPANDRLSPAVEEPDDPLRPFVWVELWARNRGKTETLIRNTATLKAGDLTIHPRAVDETLGFGVYTGHYFRLKPGEVRELRFSQHPEHTNVNQLKAFSEKLQSGSARAVVSIRDYDDNEASTTATPLRERLPYAAA